MADILSVHLRKILVNEQLTSFDTNLYYLLCEHMIFIIFVMWSCESFEIVKVFSLLNSSVVIWIFDILIGELRSKFLTFLK